MELCNLCGGVIVIRWVNFSRIPIHVSGRCGTSQPDPPKAESKEAKESFCRLTTCKHCGKGVFFIRHNGGSVWINPPLGHPWIKHGCMYPDDVRAGRSLALVSFSHDEVRPGSLLLAVVIRAEYDGSRSTTLELASNESDRWSAIVKYDCQFWRGELVIVDRGSRKVFRYDAPEFSRPLIKVRKL